MENRNKRRKKEECILIKWRKEFGCMSPVHTATTPRWRKCDKYIIEDLELKLSIEFNKELLIKLFKQDIMNLFLNQSIFTKEEIDELVRIDKYFDVPRVSLIVENNITDVLIRFIHSKYQNIKQFCTSYKNSILFKVDYNKLLRYCFQPIVESNDYTYLHFLDSLEIIKWKQHGLEAAVHLKSVDLLNTLLKDYKCPLTHFAFIEAVEVNDNIKVLEWLLKNKCPWNELVIPNAAKFDNINVLNWLLKNKCPYDKKLFYYYKELYTPRVSNWLTRNFNKIPFFS